MFEVPSPDPDVGRRIEEAERFLHSARTIMDHAAQESIALRLLGSLAYRLRCPQNAHLLDEMQRVLTDLDFGTERRYAAPVNEMLKNLGYIPDFDIATATGGERYFFKHPDTGLGVDIFMDSLSYCHPIPFKGRLEIDRYTLPLAELFLEKMQIVELNEKDVKDTIVLLLEHDIGDEDGELINIKQVSRMLADDWGFYYTVTLNLEKIKNLVGKYKAVSAQECQIVLDRIEGISSRIEEESKSVRWKIRAKIGPRKRWYATVDAH